jgi:hypothetical protein
MTTTCMRSSIVGDAWIQEMCRLNPVQRVMGENGQPNGNILTGPVRLSFCDSLFTAQRAMKSDANSRVVHATSMLFPPFTDFAIFWEEFYRIAAADFASHYDAPSGQYYGLDNPIFDQGTKLKYDGYTPGLMALNTSSQFKPPVVDMRGNPTDPSKVYPGVWAIVALNAYASGKQAPRKGPRFGLQSVMIIGDDKPISGGGAVDPKAQFANVSVRPPTTVAPAAFGQAVQTPPQGQGVAAFYPPGAPPTGPVIPGRPPMPVAPGVPADDDLSSLY